MMVRGYESRGKRLNVSRADGGAVQMAVQEGNMSEGVSRQVTRDAAPNGFDQAVKHFPPICQDPHNKLFR